MDPRHVPTGCNAYLGTGKDGVMGNEPVFVLNQQSRAHWTTHCVQVQD